MSLSVTPFEFAGQHVRVVDGDDGEPWFVAKDVASVLGYVEERKAVAAHCKGGARRPLPTDGGTQLITIIPERDVYRLIMRSKLPAAEQFEEWVVGTVLPAIRKHGGYLAAAPEETEAELAVRALTVLQATVARQKAHIAAVQPKADALDRLASADGSLCCTDAAKALQVRPKDLLDYLSQHHWIYRRQGNGHWVGYQSKTTSGDLEHKVTTVLRPDGSEKITEQVRITPRGMAKLAQLMPGRLGLVDETLFPAA